MICKKGTSVESYKFCINAPYYDMLVQLLTKKKTEVEKVQKCDKLSTKWNYSPNESIENICKEFKFLYQSLSKYRGEATPKNDPFTEDDCNFLNYWLNDKLRNNNKDISICVKEFYQEIKRQDNKFFSNPKEVDKYFYVIDPNILENMKFLYELYNNAVKIVNMITDEVYTDEDNKSCAHYIEECDKIYKEAMNRCLNSNIDYYNALQTFNASYDVIFDPSFNKLNNCNYSEFLFFPKYDPVSERRQKRIMLIKNITTPLIVLLIIPLLYKFTPFGSFFREKIKMVKDKWVSQNKYGNELLLLSTDIEDNNSDNGEYNIGYYSETN
ncbi:PIR Superfamily Protein [Plasmodium ovale wallikeri]|uniref:PIR Superfamily Protein n=2 Tax=Plasmodium ovale TaxID=36330 RepID=A0A1A9APZ8_PLAOA|nr:PIR Superfamily Protein [Plasmodium ovale wallikeri]SBT58307.1 PIR Superfamily Protein [Plasmodium ovale wallikeri]SBT74040.1 PIR protein [Plasmodium ovale]